MGVRISLFRTLMYQASRAGGRRLADMLVTPAQLQVVRDMTMEVNEAVANTMAKREALTANQLVLLVGIVAAAVLKLVKDLWGEDAGSLLSAVMKEEWTEIRDEALIY